MKLHQIGELGLLKEIRKRFKSTDSSIIIGIGDDAAAITPQKEKILVTTDMMNEGIHFDLGFTSSFHLGFKLVSANASDIFAMGGRPRYLVLNIAMKKDTEEEFFWDMYKGIFDAMNIYRVSLIGGDLCSSKNDMVLSATVIGTGNKIITRCGACVGDKIYVTGTIGDSACGLEILKRLTYESKEIIKNLEFWSNNHKNIGVLEYWNNESKNTIDWNIAKPLIKRHLMPIARDSLDISNYATSMIDISDGLFIDLLRLCDESNVGAKIYLDKIPLSDEMKKFAEIMGLDPIHLAASGGEDYELLFTAPPEIKFKIRNLKSKILKTTCIGEIIEKDRVVIDKSGKESALKAEGYRHFETG
ncbi:thiamine-monophosphate kinase [Dissulfurispira thermophila]|uniref:Thiamine-monophosphate kinase n=2 Tax=root TaxID=1 RepID=A0A7G1H3K3_9BACT|nr:thiamine-phosphate kinase [Dissulfurispira thermophila]BCB96759.1 thiamine-monophosphate kinase [Dissulfurispira thermophila]